MQYSKIIQEANCFTLVITSISVFAIVVLVVVAQMGDALNSRNHNPLGFKMTVSKIPSTKIIGWS